MLSLVLIVIFIIFIFISIYYHCQTTKIEYSKNNKLSSQELDFGLGDTFISPYLHKKAGIPIIPSSQPLIYNVDDTELRKEIKKFVDNNYMIPCTDVFLSVGSANVYSIILTSLIDKAQHIIYTAPTYGLVLDLGGEFGYELTQNIDDIDIDTTIEYIVTPNNPTNEIMLSRTKSKYKLYDISYFSYCTDEERQMIRDDIAQSKEEESIVYVVGSMSKEFLTPGYRVGFLLSYDAIDYQNLRNLFFNSIIALGGNNLYAAISRIRNNNPKLKEMLKKILIQRNKILKDILQNHVNILSLPNCPYFFCQDDGTFQTILDEIKITYRTGRMSYMTPANHYTRLNLYQTNQNFDELVRRLKTKYNS